MNQTKSTESKNTLDPHTCYQAMQSKDRRFDGLFFVGISSTKIFCRAICSARLPKLENCTFYKSAAAAQQAGYRPCLRCRPELAPTINLPATHNVINQALQLIEKGALDNSSVADLSQQLGINARTLRQQFAHHIGTSPTQVAKTRRLLFAKRLIDETALSMTDIAISAGFKSIRTFNNAFQNTYGRSPSSFRRKPTTHKSTQTDTQTSAPTDTLSLKLPFTTPYNWPALMAFWQPRSIHGIEIATATQYCRSFTLPHLQKQQPGWLSVSPVPGQAYLQVNIGNAPITYISQIMSRLRQMFDVSANITAIENHLANSPILATLTGQSFRIPGAWDPFELTIRAIVGQQISVAAATTIFNRIVTTYGEPLCISGAPTVLNQIFPTAQVLTTADLTSLGLVKSRARTINHLAKTVVEQPHFFDEVKDLDSAVKKLCDLPGIGPWTAHYIALRALSKPDAFPPGDLALLRAVEKLGHTVDKKELIALSEAWRPWRGYAAMCLWQGKSLWQGKVKNAD